MNGCTSQPTFRLERRASQTDQAGVHVGSRLTRRRRNRRR